MLPGLLQQSEITDTTTTEAKIIADNQMPELQALEQHTFNEFLGRQGRKSRIEGTDHRLLGTAFGQQLKFLAQGGQARWRRGRCEELAGMRLESQHCRCQTMALCRKGQLADQRSMTKMHPIEIPDSENYWSTNWTRMAAKNTHELVGVQKHWIITAECRPRRFDRCNIDKQSATTQRLSL